MSRDATLPRVLVIEDNALNLELVVDILAASGFEPLTATTAEAGIARALAEAPDIIIMDIALPGMDGLEATRRLRADERTREIPILALTASAMRGDEQRVRSVGCDAYLSKPFDLGELLAELRALLRARGGSGGG